MLKVDHEHSGVSFQDRTAHTFIQEKRLEKALNWYGFANAKTFENEQKRDAQYPFHQFTWNR